MTFEQALITHRLIPGSSFRAGPDPAIKSAYRVKENGEVEDVLYAKGRFWRLNGVKVKENGEVEDVLYPPINYGDIAVEKLFNPEAKNRDTWQVILPDGEVLT